MRLTYRGYNYEHKPAAVETTASNISGKYRGLDWRFRKLKKSPILQPRVNLTYRGVKYNQPETNTTQAVETEATPVLSAKDKARLLMVHQTQGIKKRQQSLLSRVAMEIGKSCTNTKFLNCIQGKVHPSFRINYARGSTAMS